jgi:hypothetical protein
MKSKVVHEYEEGPRAKSRFESAVKKVIAIPHSEMKRREKQYQSEQALKPKRGPKRKAKSSASHGHDSDD